MAKEVIDVDGKQYDAEVHESLDHRFVVDVTPMPGVEWHVNGNTREEAIDNAIRRLRLEIADNLSSPGDKSLGGPIKKHFEYKIGKIEK